MKKALKWVGIVFVGLIVIGALIGGEEENNDIATANNDVKVEQPAETPVEEPKVEEPAGPDYSDVSTAKVMAEEFVKKNLKSPSTAKFPGWLEQDQVIAEDLGEGVYLIMSWVDSQNGFGAMIRTKYICTVKYAGNDRWKCEDLTFE